MTMIGFPAGFAYVTDFISHAEETTLLNHIRLLNWQKVELFGKTAKRRVFHFGLNYTYETRQVEPTIPPPEFLHGLIHRSASYLNVAFTDIAEILITHYPIDAGIGWHRDSPVFDNIIGVSLGNNCEIRF